MPGFFNAQDYIDVQERIVQFWKEHPNGAIRTSLESDQDDFERCRYRAEVFKETSQDAAMPDATGYAFETAGGKGANSTSHEENCETSAIGRALANMGYATSRKDRPSRQEMRKVENNPQQPAQRPQDAPVRYDGPDNAGVAAARDRANKRVHALLDHDTVKAAVRVKYGLESTAEATAAQLNAIADLEEGKADPRAVPLWHAWKEKRKAEQAELLPDMAAVPNPDRFTN